MRDFSKYQGVIPAFYACYDDLGAVSATKVRELTRYLIGKGVKGLYVGGSPASASTRAWRSASWSWRM